MRLQLDINIRGKDCPAPITKWEEGGFIQPILDVIYKSRYNKPFPIQQQV